MKIRQILPKLQHKEAETSVSKSKFFQTFSNSQHLEREELQAMADRISDANRNLRQLIDYVCYLDRCRAEVKECMRVIQNNHVYMLRRLE